MFNAQISPTSARENFVKAGLCEGAPSQSILSSFRDAPLGAGPESITPVSAIGDELNHRGYGFRARARAHPGMTTCCVWGHCERGETPKSLSSPRLKNFLLSFIGK